MRLLLLVVLVQVALPVLVYSELLQLLLANAGHPLPVERLLSHVWGSRGAGDRQLVKQLVHRLRQKIELDAKQPRYLITVAGVGYPLIRSRASNLKLLLEADTNKLVDKYKSTNTQIDKRIRGLTLTVSADALDEFFGGGSTRADLALRSGNLTFDLTDPGAFNADQLPAGPRTAGGFSKATLIAQRQQTVTRELSLQGFINLQATNKNLDSSEKLTLGGPATLPGYANGEASGDEGVLVKLAVRWQAMAEFAVSVFADYGRVQLAH